LNGNDKKTGRKTTDHEEFYTIFALRAQQRDISSRDFSRHINVTSP